MGYYPSLHRFGSTVEHSIISGELYSKIGDPYLDKRWNRYLHDIRQDFNFEWDRTQKRWVVVHNKPCAPPYVVAGVNEIGKPFRPLNSYVLHDIRRAMYIGSQHGGYKMWAREQMNEAAYRKRALQRHEDEETLQAGKEVAPLLRSIADAGKESYGKSVFKFPGFGESKIHGGGK